MDLDMSQWTSNLSLEKILSGDLSGIVSVLYLAILIAIYSVVIYHFYRFVARRDCFKPSQRKYGKAITFIKYFLLFPFVAILFFIGFSLMLLFLAKDIEIDVVLSTSFAIIIAIRVTSYYTEDLSKDVAKMLPFALLGVYLVSPTFFDMDTIIEKINSLPQLLDVAVRFIVFIILLEWILRIILKIRCYISPKKQNQQPLDIKQQ